MPTEPSDATTTAERPRRPRFVAEARSLDALLGAHPRSLRDLYADGQPAVPEQLSGQRTGRLLAVEALEPVHLLVSPVLRLVAEHLVPWRGPSFDEDGSAGHHRVLRFDVLPFRCEPGPSEVDGRPTLFLRHDGLGLPWPLRRTVDELRVVGDEVAIGPASLRTVRGPIRLFWWGLELG